MAEVVNSWNAGVAIASALLLIATGALLGRTVRLLRDRRTGASTALLSVYCNDFGVPPTDGAMRLMGRYLQRTQAFRQAWTWIGVGASIGLTFIWRPPDGRADWGLTVYPPTSNVILMALGFWFVGLVRSEMYHLRPRFSGTRRVSLEVRDVARYIPRRMVVLPRITALGALGLVVASELLPHQGPDHGVIVGLGVCAAVALLVTEACQRGIAHRSRPVLSPDLRSADEAIRRMASWSVAYGSAGLITMLAAFEAVLMSQPPVVATTLHGTSAFHDATGYVANAYFPRAICLFGAVLLFFWAVGLAWQARRMVKPWPRSRSQAAAESLA